MTEAEQQRFQEGVELGNEMDTLLRARSGEKPLKAGTVMTALAVMLAGQAKLTNSDLTEMLEAFTKIARQAHEFMAVKEINKDAAGLP